MDTSSGPAQIRHSRAKPLDRTDNAQRRVTRATQNPANNPGIMVVIDGRKPRRFDADRTHAALLLEKRRVFGGPYPVSGLQDVTETLPGVPV